MQLVEHLEFDDGNGKRVISSKASEQELSGV